MVAGRESDPAEPLQSPEPSLWHRISAEIAADAGESRRTGTIGSVPDPQPDLAEEPDAPPVPLSPRRESRRRRTPRGPLLLLAAAVGLVVGVGGTVLVNRIDAGVEVLATTDLVALPGEAGSGRAELIRADGTEKLRVWVRTAVPASEFAELWLINADGARMYSLGVLPPSGEWSYSLPTVLSAGLDGYTIVDVSLEPHDGDTGHSTHSLLRGTLPA